MSENRMNGRSNRRRGGEYERALVAWLREHGVPYAERAGGGRAQQHGDVLGIPGVHLDAKNRARLDLAAWVDQAVAEATRGSVPLVVIRRRGISDRGQDYAVLQLRHVVPLLLDEDTPC
jgi:hypothetical protein